MYVRNYKLWRTWLGHCLKSADSEHLSIVNMLKGPKYLWNYLRFHILLTETFPNSFFTRVMTKYDKSAVAQIQAVFGTF